MTSCPIALLVGCKKCPAFSFCPLTTVLGDQEKMEEGSSRRADLYNHIKKQKVTCEDKSAGADDHLDKMDDFESQLKQYRFHQDKKIKPKSND
mgnify:FL=1